MDPCRSPHVSVTRGSDKPGVSMDGKSWPHRFHGDAYSKLSTTTNSMAECLYTQMNRIAFFLLACCVGPCLVAPVVAQDQPTRPPITGIAHVRIYATDLAKSSDFYSRMLGLPPRSGGCTGMSRPCFVQIGR